METTTAVAVTGMNLLKRMSEVDLSVQRKSGKPLMDGDRIIAELDDNLKRLVSVRSELCAESEKIYDEVTTRQNEHSKAHDEGRVLDGECVQHHAKLREAIESMTSIESQIGTIDNIFWQLIDLQFPTLNSRKQNLVVRDGYQLVCAKKSNAEDTRINQSFEEGLKEALSGMGVQIYDL